MHAPTKNHPKLSAKNYRQRNKKKEFSVVCNKFTFNDLRHNRPEWAVQWVFFAGKADPPSDENVLIKQNFLSPLRFRHVERIKLISFAFNVQCSLIHWYSSRHVRYVNDSRGESSPTISAQSFVIELIFLGLRSFFSENLLPKHVKSFIEVFIFYHHHPFPFPTLVRFHLACAFFQRSIKIIIVKLPRKERAKAFICDHLENFSTHSFYYHNFIFTTIIWNYHTICLHCDLTWDGMLSVWLCVCNIELNSTWAFKIVRWRETEITHFVQIAFSPHLPSRHHHTIRFIGDGRSMLP